MMWDLYNSKSFQIDSLIKQTDALVKLDKLVDEYDSAVTYQEQIVLVNEMKKYLYALEAEDSEDYEELREKLYSEIFQFIDDYSEGDDEDCD